MAITGTEQLSIEDIAAGYVLVELGPKLLNLNPDGRYQGKHPRAGEEEVRSGIFWEHDERHPNGGDISVTAGRVVKVFPTEKVKMACVNDRLALSDQPATPIPASMEDRIEAMQFTPEAQRAAAALTTGEQLAALRLELAEMEAKLNA